MTKKECVLNCLIRLAGKSGSFDIERIIEAFEEVAEIIEKKGYFENETNIL